MSYKDKYNRLNVAYGEGARASYIKATKDTINQSFLNNPSAKQVRFNDSEEKQWVWIVEDTKLPTVKNIVMPPEKEIQAGSLVHWNGEKWLCVSVDKSNKEMYEKGFIEKCNSTLKWVDEEGEIQSYPSVFYYGTRANFGTFDDKVMTLPDGRRQVVVQRNEHTQKIDRGHRFMFGGSVFKVIDFDHVSDEGIANINMKDDLFNPARDNRELGIADYYKSEVKYSIEIIGGNSIQVQTGDSLQLQVIVKKDGNIVHNPILIFSSTDESILAIDESGVIDAIAEGSADVVVMYQNEHSIVSVDVIDGVVEDVYSIVINSNASLPSEIKDGQSKSYYAEIYYSSDLVEGETIIWELYSDDKSSSTNLAKITSQSGMECIVRNNDVTNGHVQLRVSSNVGNGVESWLRIRMRPLF